MLVIFLVLCCLAGGHLNDDFAAHCPPLTLGWVQGMEGRLAALVGEGQDFHDLGPHPFVVAKFLHSL